jgi:hypothetical protein
MLLNKHDLQDQWVTSESEIAELENRGWWVRRSSARTGESVEDAFNSLATRTLR